MLLTKFIDVFERKRAPGETIKQRYKILEFLGKGSYGLAYKAVDLLNNDLVVIKQLRKRKKNKYSNQNTLKREAEILRALNHPAIPKWIDYFEIDSDFFLVMEFISGENVEELIFYQNKKFSIKESFLVLLEVLSVIQYIHEKQIIHRDLRLPNILLNEKRVFIIDFGLAVYLDDFDPQLEKTISMEKRLFREISYASDFYALGHFLLFLLYSNYEFATKIERSWEEELPLNKEQIRMIKKLLKIEPAYEHVRELIEDLKASINNVE
jgi:serine/threonine protein kinase, bacterial